MKNITFFLKNESSGVNVNYNDIFSGEINPFSEKFDQILSSFKFIEPIDTSDWQTYRNEEYGYEVRYPGDWAIDPLRSNREESGSDIVFDIGMPGSHEGIKVNVSDLSLDEWANQGDDAIIEGIYHLTIGGQPAIRIDTTEFGQKLIATKFNGKFYIFFTGGRMIDNDMLSTFKFID